MNRKFATPAKFELLTRQNVLGVASTLVMMGKGKKSMMKEGTMTYSYCRFYVLLQISLEHCSDTCICLFSEWARHHKLFN